MSTNPYSHRIRILACAGCGAPLEAAIEGGAFRCSYCGALNQLERRDEARDLARVAASASVTESERMARLRDQERQGEPLPASVARFVEDGSLDPARVDEARVEWLRARAALLDAPSSYPLGERLFYLTILLVPRVSEHTRRAVLESAIELCPDEGHRHVLRCALARLAARAGDVAAAEQWLAPCNPRPLDLSMDTAYRYAASTLAVARGDHQGALALLGLSVDDVPLAERDALGCTLVRIHALESTGREREAVAALRAEYERRSTDEVASAIEEQRPLVVCARATASSRLQDARRELAVSEELFEQANRPWLDRTRALVFARFASALAVVLTLVGWWAMDGGTDAARDAWARVATAFLTTLPLALACTAMLMVLSYIARRGRRLERRDRVRRARREHDEAAQRRAALDVAPRGSAPMPVVGNGDVRA